MYCLWATILPDPTREEAGSQLAEPGEGLPKKIQVVQAVARKDLVGATT